jgi:5-methylcytosine-specific restriction endonuclease McrA
MVTAEESKQKKVARNKRYAQSLKGKAAKARGQKTYRLSPKGQLAQKRGNAHTTAKRQAMRRAAGIGPRNLIQSDEDRAERTTQWKARYRSTLKGKTTEQAYRQRTKEQDKLSHQKYRRSVKGKATWSAANAKRRALHAQAPINDFTKEQWTAMQEEYKHQCAYCTKRAKGKLTRDHIVPLSKGGSHTASNIVPACRSCNSKKRSGPILAPIQQRLFL